MSSVTLPARARAVAGRVGLRAAGARRSLRAAPKRAAAAAAGAEAELEPAEPAAEAEEETVAAVDEEADVDADAGAEEDFDGDDVEFPAQPPAKVKLADVVPGDELTGVVRSIKPYGAFVDVGAESDGLVHISEMSNKFVRDIYSVVSVDDSVNVRVLTVDEAGKRLSLSMKSKPFEANPGDKITGKIVNIVDFGAFVNLSPGTDGLVHRSEVTSDPYADWESFCEVGKEVEVTVLEVDPKSNRISLSMRDDCDAYWEEVPTEENNDE